MLRHARIQLPESRASVRWLTGFRYWAKIARSAFSALRRRHNPFRALDERTLMHQRGSGKGRVALSWWRGAPPGGRVNEPAPGSTTSTHGRSNLGALDECAPPRTGPALQQLISRLMAQRARPVALPRGPLTTVFADAEELVRLVERREVRRGLLAVGVAPDRLAELPLAIAALREAETQRLLERAAVRSPSRSEAEQAAVVLREEIRAACGWNLRTTFARGALARITDSTDPADLMQDLIELGQLLRENRNAFGNDHTFDLPARSSQAVALAGELGRAPSYPPTSGPRRSDPPPSAAEVRDRAFSYLSTLAEELHQAGQYAFRSDHDIRRLFTAISLNRPLGWGLRTTLHDLST